MLIGLSHPGMPVDLALLASFLLFSLVLAAVPGPSVVLSTSRAITAGRGPAMRIVLGGSLAGLILVAIVVSGLGAILAASTWVLTVLKWLGAAYLVLLGVRALLAARRTALLIEPAMLEDEPAPTRPFRAGVLVGLSNPKSLVALTAVLPQFVDPMLGAVPLQLAILGLAGCAVQLVVETAWVLAATRLRSWFLERPRRRAVLEAGGGVAMIALAGRIILERPAAT